MDIFNVLRDYETFFFPGCRSDQSFSEYKFMWRSLNPWLQSYWILYFRCQRKTLSFCHPLLNCAPYSSFCFLFSSFLPSLISFIFCYFSAYLLFFFCGPHPLLSPLIPFILFNRVDPFLCLLSSPLIATPLSFQRLAFRFSLLNPKPILRGVVSHSWHRA